MGTGNAKVNPQRKRVRFTKEFKLASESEEFRVIYRTKAFIRSLGLALGLLLVADVGRGPVPRRVRFP
jgi:hypothetical protein